MRHGLEDGEILINSSQNQYAWTQMPDNRLLSSGYYIIGISFEQILVREFVFPGTRMLGYWMTGQASDGQEVLGPASVDNFQIGRSIQTGKK